LLIYISRRPFAGPGFGTFSTLEGCQRVIEPDLSPLLYKSKPFVEELILVLLPNNVPNILHIKANLQIKFSQSYHCNVKAVVSRIKLMAKYGANSPHIGVFARYGG